jgi:hypothetical protein
VIITAVSTALAHQSKALVEDPFRRMGFAASRRWMPFAFAAFCIGYSAFCALFVLHQVRLRDVSDGAQAGDRDHPGAMALYAGTKFHSDVPYVPQPLRTLRDQSQAYEDGCIGGLIETTVRRCEYGDKTSKYRMVIVGDSHAVHWIPTFDIIAKRRGWRLTAITKGSCPLADITTDRVLRDQFKYCIRWNRLVLRELMAEKPDVVVFAQSIGSLTGLGSTREEGMKLVADGILSAWKKLKSRGVSIIAIRDTPRLDRLPAECMGAAGAKPEDCSVPRKAALPSTLGSMPVADPIIMAARHDKDVLLVDMTNLICAGERCMPVVGNVMVWRDTHHLTASYAKTLATPMEHKIYRVMDRAIRK